MIRPDISTLKNTQLSRKYFSRVYPEYTALLDREFPSLDWKDKLYLDQRGMTEIPVCPVCGKRVKLISLFKGYPVHCSQRCAFEDSSRTRKIQSTMKERYGVSHALQSRKIREKYKKTCEEKWGTDNPAKNSDVRKKSWETMKERYGGWGSESEIIKSKSRETRRKNRLDDMTIPGQVGYGSGGWIIRCGKDHLCDGCDGTFIIPAGNYLDRVRCGADLCTKINPIGGIIRNTSVEKFVRDLLDEYNIKYTTNDRSVISPREVDIYIPDRMIAIECNGCYWHSDLFKRNSYHQDKWKECEERGVQLLTVWEDWIRTKPDIVKSIILSKLGIYDSVIYGRKCEVREISSRECSEFLEQNHIQGSVRSTIRAGLYYKDELAAVMTFSHRSKLSGPHLLEEGEWELTRFCSRRGEHIIGGAGKLLSYFIKHYHPVSVVSFSSNDISDGGLYRRLGFERGESSRSYWYVDMNTFKRYHRSSFSKHSLRRRGVDTDGKSEREAVREMPFWRIYDSGITRWTLSRI